MKTLGRLATMALVVVWFVLLRPVALGGPAGYQIVTGHSMEPTLHTGDLVVTQSARTYAAGDLIAFHVPAGQPGAGASVIHRIVGGDASGFITKGDNNPAVDPWHPAAADVMGRAWVEVPDVGFALAAVQRPPLLPALLATLVAVWFYTTNITLPHRKATQA